MPGGRAARSVPRGGGLAEYHPGQNVLSRGDARLSGTRLVNTVTQSGTGRCYGGQAA